MPDVCGFKLDGQKAFLTGKLKTKGNMMLATKLAAVLDVGNFFPVIDATANCSTDRQG